MRSIRFGGAALGVVTVALCAALAARVSAQISGVNIVNTGDADFTVDGLTDGRQFLSQRTISSSPTSISARYAWVSAADSGAFTNSSISSNAAYRINFNVNVPGSYQLTVATNWSGGLTTVDDTTLATVAATADVGALTGTQSGGTLVSGSLSLGDPGVRTSGATGQCSFGSPCGGVAATSATATINGTSNGVNVPHQLNFSWTTSCNSPGGGALVGGDECAVRAGLPATISGQTAGDYPGAGSLSRTQANDGHFVSVSIVSLCGNGVVDGSFGEECDQGVANGTFGSCCKSNCTLKTDGTVCRNPAGVCDAPETCNGVSPTCPADVYLPPSTVCRATSAGEECDEDEYCTGSGVDCPADEIKPIGTVCRGVAGACDIAETCDGTTKICPTDAFVTAGTTCRASAGACDIAEVCSGSGPNCPADAKSTAVCRASGGVCDPAESCNGVSNTCPPDAKSTAQCRASGGVCDVAEFCDGVNNACPADAKVTAGTQCRASAGICDVAETCNGVSNACPANSFLPNGTVCRAVAGDCDVAEVCNGSNANCPADAFKPASTLCRAASAGEACDINEFCTGSGANCPADLVEPATTLCRAASPGEVCDVDEYCDGTNKTCPTDAVQPNTTVCRTSSGVCDVAETCNGTTKTCPADAVLPNGSTCRASAGVCDVTEVCDGTNKTCPADAKSTAVCRSAAGVCDVTEVCDGLNNDCPANDFVADGTNCDDSNFCNGTQTCSGGVCGGGSSPCGVGESCDESLDLCFTGDCPVNPVSCRGAAKNKLLIKNKPNDDQDKLIWKWAKGDATTQTEFADPTTSATYALCFYAGATPTLINGASIAPDAGKWAAIGSKGYKFNDVSAINDGITKIIVKGGGAGKSKALVKGKAASLPDFDSNLPVAPGDLPVIVQLRNNATGICWGSSFASPKKNQLDQFSAKTP
ncbi:hypothetical protein KF840_16790 [bacterium]|nr:hypothetical protein [bacterium]